MPQEPLMRDQSEGTRIAVRGGLGGRDTNTLKAEEDNDWRRGRLPGLADVAQIKTKTTRRSGISTGFLPPPQQQR